MNLDYGLNGVHGANHYLWANLKDKLGWSESDYNGLVPITPVQQQPEFIGFNKPFLVYAYSIDPIGVSSWEKSETASYSIFSSDEEDIRECINLMVKLFKDYDKSADDLNRYVSENLSEGYQKFDYKYIRIAGGSGSQPAEQEGGRMDGLVTVNYVYTMWDHSDSAGYGLELP
jgi:hypothetical protein